jgi:hypothetical protein
MMLHFINGEYVDLRQLYDDELEAMAQGAEARVQQADEEHESIMGEIIRRQHATQ